MREIRTLRAMWRALETELRQLLNGHEEGNLGYKPRRNLRATAPALDPTGLSTLIEPLRPYDAPLGENWAVAEAWLAGRSCETASLESETPPLFVLAACKAHLIFSNRSSSP